MRAVCGLDVHKDTIYLCILCETGEIFEHVYGVFKKIHGRIINKHGRETILASLTGVVSEAEKDTMRQLRAELTLAEEHKQECHNKMVNICETYYPKEFKRLMTIPGIKERAATSLIA